MSGSDAIFDDEGTRYYDAGVSEESARATGRPHVELVEVLDSPARPKKETEVPATEPVQAEFLKFLNGGSSLEIDAASSKAIKAAEHSGQDTTETPVKRSSKTTEHSAEDTKETPVKRSSKTTEHSAEDTKETPVKRSGKTTTPVEPSTRSTRQCKSKRHHFTASPVSARFAALSAKLQVLKAAQTKR